MASNAPASSGTSVPTTSFELMRQLRAAEREDNKNHSLQQKQNRFRKIEIQRETLEVQLMGFEDYTGTVEGQRRQRAFEDRVNMETEDLLSGQVEAYHKEMAEEFFRNNIRAQAEERRRQEELEREKKRQFAEQRRQAVLERIRKKKEEEEELIRQAELRKQMIEEENQRILRELEEKLRAEQREMVMEDDLSRLAEAEYKDELERRAWREQEAQRIAEWEEAQLLKDLAEKEARKARSAELEVKKKKLAELKKAQQEQAGTNGSKADATAARAEQVKLGKQMRIQNKAKFVSKRIKDSHGGDQEDLDLSSAGKSPSGSSKGGAPQTSLLLPSLPAVSEGAEHRADNHEALLGAEVVASIKGMSSETELRELQKNVMVEKRKLRLEQRQSSSDNVGATHAAADENDDVSKKVAELTAKESVIVEQIEKVLHKAKEEPQLGGEDNANAVDLGRLEDPPPVSPLLKKSDSTASMVSKKSFHSRQGGIGISSHGDVFEQAESLLQAVKSAVNSDHSAHHQHGDSRQSMRSDGHHGQPIILLELKISELMKRMPHQSNMDPLGYKDKLHSGLLDLEKLRHERANTTSMPAKKQLPKKHESTGSKPTEAASVREIVRPARKSTSDASAVNGTVQLEEHTLIESSSVPDLSNRKSANGRVTADTTSTQRHNSTPVLYQLSSSFEIEEERKKPSAGAASIATTVHVTEHVTEERSRARTVINQDSQRRIAIQMETINEETRSTVRVEGGSTKLQQDVTKEVSNERSTANKLKAGEKESVAMNVNIEMEEVVEEFSDDDIEEDPYANIPGWTECLNTTMATSAHHAAFYGYADVLELLSKYFDVFVMDDKGRTPLFYAALRNQLAAVTMLVSIEPQWIEVGDIRGDTPLHAAAISDSVKVLEFFLTCEVNPDIANSFGFTCAHIANSSAVLDLLYRWGGTLYCVDNENRMPLFLACKDGRPDCVNYLCRATPLEYLLWADADGNNCLHIASMNGHAKCVEEICRWLSGVESFYITNLKGYTAAHIASNQKVLQTLYENGADLWVRDSKGRFPLFMASFHGRFDCTLFLLDLALQKSENVIGNLDRAGDTALHAACLCGHMRCVILLLFFLRDYPNNAGLTPSQLATRANHGSVVELVTYVEQQRIGGYSTLDILGCAITSYLPVAQYYGSRWTKLYDAESGGEYYFDRVSGVSQWDRPITFDENPAEEHSRDVARGVLKQFYSKYNPEKLKDMNEILFVFRENYSELFIQLANRYSVEDLWMFEGVVFD